MSHSCHTLHNTESGRHPLPGDAREIRAAQSLRTARQDWISPPYFTALAASFDSATSLILGNGGGLLVAAVCDECGGLTEAVPSLVRWMGDPERFPADWCTAVEATLARARAGAGAGRK